MMSAAAGLICHIEYHAAINIKYQGLGDDCGRLSPIDILMQRAGEAFPEHILLDDFMVRLHEIFFAVLMPLLPRHHDAVAKFHTSSP